MVIRPRLVSLLCLLFGLTLSAPGRAEEVADVTLDPWLVLSPTDPGGRAPFRPNRVFERYLLPADPPVPVLGEGVRGSNGREERWREATDLGDARWAYTTVTAREAGVRLLELQRVAVVFVGSRPVYGDVYGHGIVRTPVFLEKGPNPLYAFAFRGRFEVTFHPAPGPLVLAAFDPTLPDLVRGRASPPHAAVLLLNASREALRDLTVTARVEAGAHSISTSLDLPWLAPLGQVKVPLVVPGLEVEAGTRSARLFVEVKQGAEVLAARAYPLEVKDADEPYRRTFRSAIDGSIQVYAVREPQGPTGDPSTEPGLVLTLHGASVPCLNQVRAYSPKPDLWIVAPTNRRPFGFDWQDWGRKDAYEVLHDALEATGVDRRRVWLTGHSMGGHGTWHLAVNDPDGFGAIAPSAAWISFDTYGGPRPKSGPLDALWRAADLASDTLLLKTNLAHPPIRQLHGGADENVPLSEALRMKAELEGVAGDYDLTVVEGKGHWWDGDAAEGTDCVDWPPFFETFRRHPIPPHPEAIRFVSADPAVDSRHFWVRVLQATQVGLALEVTARHEGNTLVVETKNVRTLALDPPPAWTIRSVRLDGRVHARPPENGPWCLSRRGGSWTERRAPLSPGERSPERSGPFKRLFDRRFVLVAGTAGTDAEDGRTLARARYDAERWRVKANGHAELVTDALFLAEPARYRGRNVVLYGNATTNAAWSSVLGSEAPIGFEKGKARVGEETFEGEDLAGFFLQPRKDDDRALAGAVAWTGEPGRRLTILSGYLSSGVGIPDYVLFGPGVLERGDEGVKRAGLFDNRWQLGD